MKNVLVIAESDTHAVSWVQTVLSTQGQFQVSSSCREGMRRSHLLGETKFDFIVFDCKILDESEVEFLHLLCNQAPTTPFLIMAREVTIQTYIRVGEFQNMVALQAPCDPKMFLSLVGRFLNQQEVKPAVCPRFIMNHPVRILVLDNGLHVPTRLRNFSISGAFLEYHGISLKVGDRLLVNLDPSQSTIKKKAELVRDARVIWVHEGEGPRSPHRGVGVQFLHSQKDMSPK